ncbi:hypothetical protein BJ742DRAFT_787508 [Cladochytrium replicatum]|nr:hypothetical protein BJ742DRAFT_787508 [Cladochytrium replicatum]
MSARPFSRSLWIPLRRSSTSATGDASNANSIKTSAPTIKRFWKTATFGADDDGSHFVALDSRKLRTPDGKPVRIDAERYGLAAAIAAEWEKQDKMLKPTSLPLTGIIMRALDSFSDSTEVTKAIDNVCRFIHTDSICYMHDFPDKLLELQDERWKPLIQWTLDTYGAELKTTMGIFSVKQSDETVSKLRAIVESFDPIKLAAFEKAVLTTKSFVIGLALAERRITVEEAVNAARVELDAQISRWGEVEDSHDVDHADMTRQLGAVACAFIL